MNMHFLSGLPRSGSTVLSSLLNQHPQVYSSSTSGLVEIMGAICNTWESSPTTIAQGSDKSEAYRMLKSVMKSKYENISKPVIIDKNRIWVNPLIMKTMTEILGRPPKIIATVRSTADCAASFVRVANPKDLNDFLINSSLIKHLKSSYTTLYAGYEQFPKNILFVDYDDLVVDPQKEMNRIHEFLELDAYEYNFQEIDTNVVAENDEKAWGIPNLHKISSKLEYQNNQNSKDVLGHYFDSFDQPKFWISSQASTKKKKLNLSIELLNEGKIEDSFKILNEAKSENPECNKITFNMGWHLIRQNKLQEGIRCLTAGRHENCFGNPKPFIPTEIWDGKTKGKILYYLEGDIGDQIHALKYVMDIKKRGCDVIIACSPELFPIAKSCSGVRMIVNHSAANGIYHDFWIPSMSVLIPLGYNFKDIKKTKYIYNKTKQNKKIKIGLCLDDNYYGNREENNVSFNLFLENFKNIDCDFISLQNNKLSYPDFIKILTINNLAELKNTLGSCDIVISTNPVVTHLSGAMGITTWAITPLLCNYIWLSPNNKSPYYNSVMIFKQNSMNDLELVLKQIEQKIQKIAYKNNWRKIWQNISGLKMIKWLNVWSIFQKMPLVIGETLLKFNQHLYRPDK